MKANELRIGNLVLIPYNKSNKKEGFYEVTISAVGGFGGYIGPEDYQPISLTEEWLLKFGFISNPYEDRYEKGVLHVECDKTKGETQLWIENMPHIKYVHELQNLYFALTGEELINVQK
jgi:hypothetical protein